MATETTERRVRICAACGLPCCGAWEKDGTCTPKPCAHTSARHTYDECGGRWIAPSATGATQEGKG